MGLAASQARLLTITARKSDCEFTSMNLSHQKIALARDLQKISDEYQASMGLTKLVYDYYGSNQSQLDLNYNLMMSPSVYNDYYPKMLTDVNNRVILNGAFAAAAMAAGVPAEGLMGTPSSEVRNKFVLGLYQQGIINENICQEIQNTIYGNTIGLGDTVNATVVYDTMTYDEFKAKLSGRQTTAADDGVVFSQVTEDADCFNTAFIGTVKKNSDKADDLTFTFLEGDAVGGDVLNADGSRGDKRGFDEAGNKHYNPEAANQITLYKLLFGEDDYILGYNSAEDVEPISAIYNLQNDVVGTDTKTNSLLQWITNEFTDLFGGCDENEDAIRYAADMVADLLVADNENLRKYVETDGHYEDDKFAHGNENDNWILEGNDYYYSYSYKTDRFLRNDKFYGKEKKNKAKLKAFLKRGVLVGTEQWLGYIGFEGSEKYGKTLFGTEDEWSCANSLANKNYYGSKYHSGSKLISKKDDKQSVIQDYISYVAFANNSGSFKDKNKGDIGATMATINLSNIADLFLSYFVDYQKGNIGKEYDIKTRYSEQKSNMADVKNHKYQVGRSEVDTGGANLYANFYDALFNAICTQGWVQNGQVDNQEYMQELMKNGMAFISSLGSDGFFSQSDYSTDKYVREVTDTEAIARAEAKYNTLKSKIQSKEDTIDLKMRNLDTEMSTLTTEYDTIKSLISKNVEKSFKRYDA